MTPHATPDLIERRVRNDLSDDEARALDLHLLACSDCREALADAHATTALLSAAADRVAQSFDFDRARRATHNLLAARRRQSAVLTALVCTLTFSPVLLIAFARARFPMWELAAWLLFVASPLAALLMKDQWLSRRALESLSGPAAPRGFERRIRSSLSLFALNQFATLVLLFFGALFPLAAFRAGNEPAGFLMLVLWSLAAAWAWCRCISPAAAAREERLLRGDISLDDYRRERTLAALFARPARDSTADRP